MLTEAIGPFSLYLDCPGRVSSGAPRLGRFPDRRGGRVVEGAPLLRAYGSKAHRGFESLPLRHRAPQFQTFSITRTRWPRSVDSNPRYGKWGSTKSPLGDFGRRGRVARRARAEGPSQSLPLRHRAHQFPTLQSSCDGP